MGAGKASEVKADPMSAGTYRVHVQHQATNQVLCNMCLYLDLVHMLWLRKDKLNAF